MWGEYRCLSQINSKANAAAPVSRPVLTIVVTVGRVGICVSIHVVGLRILIRIISRAVIRLRIAVIVVASVVIRLRVVVGVIRGRVRLPIDPRWSWLIDHHALPSGPDHHPAPLRKRSNWWSG